MSALFVEILPHQMTNLLHVYLYQIWEERERSRAREKGNVRVCGCVCERLPLLSLPSRGQLPTPPRTTPPSQAFHSASHPRSRKHLSLNMQ